MGTDDMRDESKTAIKLSEKLPKLKIATKLRKKRSKSKVFDITVRNKTSTASVAGFANGNVKNQQCPPVSYF